MASLCHPWFTTTNLSYRFPIFETSATALCGTTGMWCLIIAVNQSLLGVPAPLNNELIMSWCHGLGFVNQPQWYFYPNGYPQSIHPPDSYPPQTPKNQKGLPSFHIFSTICYEKSSPPFSPSETETISPLGTSSCASLGKYANRFGKKHVYVKPGRMICICGGFSTSMLVYRVWTDDWLVWSPN